jgi:Na+-driven multidrug efflux pump
LAEYQTFTQMAMRLLHPGQRSPSARTVEAFGWLLLLEGGTIFLAPHWIAALLSLPSFSASAAIYFRLVGLLIAGIGMLYTVSGRLDAQGFVFASLLDRPIVPFVMLVLWYQDLIPAVLAAAFGLQDFGSFLWTLWAWRKERKR